MSKLTVTNAAIIAVLVASSTKREAAAQIGLHPGTVRNRCAWIGGDVWDRWQSLPPGGAFAGQGDSVPNPCHAQSKADALVEEAVGDAPLDPERSQGENVVGLLWAMFAVHGSMNFPRGWVRALVLSLRDAGCHPPTPAVARWYRSRFAEDPGEFAAYCPDPQLLEDLLAR